MILFSEFYLATTTPQRSVPYVFVFFARRVILTHSVFTLQRYSSDVIQGSQEEHVDNFRIIYGPGVRLSKPPKLVGPIPCAIISYVS